MILNLQYTLQVLGAIFSQGGLRKVRRAFAPACPLLPSTLQVRCRPPPLSTAIGTSRPSADKARLSGVPGATPASPPRAASGTFPCRNRILSRADSLSTFCTLKPEKGKRTGAAVPFPTPAFLASLFSVPSASAPAASNSRFLLLGGGVPSAMLPAGVCACAVRGHA